MGKEPREKFHICSYSGCNKKFSRPGRLQQHIRTHTRERPYKCEYEGCDKSYTRSQHLLRHTLISHSDGDKREDSEQHVCKDESCKRSFSNKYNLTKHEKRSHSDERNYVCPEKDCTESFRKKHQLKSHLFKHQGVLPFQCSVPGCLKKFSQSSHLHTHQKIHQGYKCKEEGCGAVFTKMSQLRKHKAAEHRKVLRCETCKKCYHKPSELANHMLVHSSEREKYKCPSCDRTYFEKRNLKSHMRRQHSGSQFTCGHEGCGVSLSTKQKLAHHMKIHTRKDRRQSKAKLRKNAAKRLLKYISGTNDSPGKSRTITSLQPSACTVSASGDTAEINPSVKSDSEPVTCHRNPDDSSIPTICNVSPGSATHAQAMMTMQDTGYRDLATDNSAACGKSPEIECMEEVDNSTSLHGKSPDVVCMKDVENSASLIGKSPNVMCITHVENPTSIHGKSAEVGCMKDVENPTSVHRKSAEVGCMKDVENPTSVHGKSAEVRYLQDVEISTSGIGKFPGIACITKDLELSTVEKLSTFNSFGMTSEISDTDEDTEHSECHSDGTEDLDSNNSIDSKNNLCAICLKTGPNTFCSHNASEGDINQENDSTRSPSSQGGNPSDIRRASPELNSLENAGFKEPLKPGTYPQCLSSTCDRGINQSVMEKKGLVISVIAPQGPAAGGTSQEMDKKGQTSFLETEESLKETMAKNAASVTKEIQIGSSAVVRFVSPTK